MGTAALAFSARGRSRAALQSVLLHHSIARGLDVCITDVALHVAYTALPTALLLACGELLLGLGRDDDDGGAQRLSDRVRELGDEDADAWRGLGVAQRLQHAVLHGIDTHIASDIDEALRSRSLFPNALGVVEGAAAGGHGGRRLWAERGQPVLAPGLPQRPRHAQGRGPPAAAPSR